MYSDFDYVVEKKEKLKIEPASIGRRALSFIFDIFAVIVFSSFLNSTLVPVLRDNFYNQDSVIEKYQNRLLESELLVYLEEEKSYTLIYTLYDTNSEEFTDELRLEYIDLLKNKVENFANNESFDCFDMDDYIELQLADKEVFAYDASSDTINYVENVDQDKVLNFYLNAAEVAFNTLPRDSVVAKYYNQIMKVRYLEMGSCIVFLALIWFFVLPLIYGKGQTFGKKALGIAVVNDNDQPIKRTSVLLRYFILVFVEILLYGIPLLISLTVMCFSKKRGAIHDILAKTKVIAAESYPTATEEIVAEENKNEINNWY